jgi:hypothetical protein
MQCLLLGLIMQKCIWSRLATPVSETVEYPILLQELRSEPWKRLGHDRVYEKVKFMNWKSLRHVTEFIASLQPPGNLEQQTTADNVNQTSDSRIVCPTASNSTCRAFTPRNGGIYVTQLWDKMPYTTISGSRDSAVGIATGYRLYDWGVGFRVPVGSRIFSSTRRQIHLWGPPGFLSNGYRGVPSPG